MIDRLLVTAFGPWEGHPVNSSALAIEPLHGVDIGGIKLEACILPVDFDRSIEVLLEAAERFEPDAIVSFGMLSRGPDIWRVELVARNRDARHDIQLEPIRARVADSDEHEEISAESVPIDPARPPIMATGLPAARIYGRLLEAGLPTELSSDCGRFVCNHLFFRALAEAEEGRLPRVTGFVHVPPPILRPGEDVPANLDPLHEGARLVAEAVLSAIRI